MSEQGSWEDRMAEKHRAEKHQQQAKVTRDVEAARRDYLGEAFLKYYPPDSVHGFEPQVEIAPEIIAANCLGITYGDPGPKLRPEMCRQCWGERYIWLGNTWGLHHQGEEFNGSCSHYCHDGEVWMA